ncbi:MAG: hypothetical protein MUO76_03380 [Anaerolineaceae bacterium]|nr:hypothetical protein [Anaerolineaceae bacterium]
MDEKVTGQVECHSGSRYGERPIALRWQGQRLEILAIEVQWRSPEGPCFRVRTGQDLVFELVYSESDDAWHIKLHTGTSVSRVLNLHDTSHLSLISKN